MIQLRIQHCLTELCDVAKSFNTAHQEHHQQRLSVSAKLLKNVSNTTTEVDSAVQVIQKYLAAHPKGW